MDFSWIEKANCRNQDIALFFEGFENASLTMKMNTIKSCLDCPVIDECYQYAIETKAEGVYGGKFFRAGMPKNPFKIKKSRDLFSQTKRNADKDLMPA